MILSADQALIINYHSRACSGVGRLVPVGRRLVGSLLVDANVDGLLVSEHGELGAELVQVEAGDLLVEVLGEHVHLLVVLLGVLLLPELELGAAQVEQTAWGLML